MDAFVEKPKEKKPLVKDDAKGVSAVDAKKKANEQVSLLDSKVLRNNGIVLKLFRCALQMSLKVASVVAR